MPKPLHYQGTYHVQAARLRAAAYADPRTICWRCGLTLEAIHRTHPRAKWTAGHTIDGHPDALLLPECSPCNYSNGAKLRHQNARRTAWTW